MIWLLGLVAVLVVLYTNSQNQMSTSSIPPTPSTPAGKLSATQIAQLASNAGFEGDDLVTAVAVCFAESAGKPGAYNPVGPNVPSGMGAIGLWQIYANVHPEFAGQNLYDPQTNADAAFSVYDAAGGSFQPWEAYTNGSYAKFIGTAQDAVNGGALA